METTAQPKSQLELIEEKLFENLTKHQEFNSETISGLRKLAKDGSFSNVSKVEQIIKTRTGG